MTIGSIRINNDNEKGYGVANPFTHHTEDELAWIVGELQTVVANLEIQAFEHADVLVSSKNVHNLLISYEIKDVLLACKRCQRLLTKDVDRRRAVTLEMSEAKQKQKDIQKECTSLERDIQFVLDKNDASITEYQQRYPNNKPVALIRVASGMTVVSISYVLLQNSIPKEPDLLKKIITGVAGFIAVMGCFDEVASFYKKAKSAICQKKKPYHIIAAKKVDWLISGAGIDAAERNQSQKTVNQNKPSNQRGDNILIL